MKYEVRGLNYEVRSWNDEGRTLYTVRLPKLVSGPYLLGASISVVFPLKAAPHLHRNTRMLRVLFRY